MNLLNEFENEKKSVINPSDCIKKNKDIPQIAIGCFSRDLFLNIISSFKNKEIIGNLKNTNGIKEIYKITYKNNNFAIFMISVGAPAAVMDIEEIHAMGCNKFIIFGNCGVLDNKINDCSIIIPNRALRDEGTSFHYKQPSQDIAVNLKYQDKFISILNEVGYSYTVGTTWTTDSFYRETRNKVNKRKEQGAIVVEMEASALQAVADFREIDLFIFFYAADNLDNEIWDRRSLSGDVKLDEKTKIAYLALELGTSIYE